jgi:hypothetical protein
MKFMTSRDIPPLWVNRYLESYDFKGIINKRIISKLVDGNIL